MIDVVSLDLAEDHSEVLFGLLDSPLPGKEPDRFGNKEEDDSHNTEKPELTEERSLVDHRVLFLQDRKAERRKEGPNRPLNAKYTLADVLQTDERHDIPRYHMT